MPPPPASASEPAPARDVTSSGLIIPASDGVALAATLFQPAQVASDAPLVVVAAGAAIPRRFYQHFAAHAASRGTLALTFDVRDIGGSRHGPIDRATTRMRDWCINDAAGVIAWAGEQHPQRRLLWVGHSMGGFATGLVHNHDRIQRQLCVGTLSGYWGAMAGFEKWRVLAMMGGLAPVIVAARGYMPGKLMGGEDMPGPAFLEWRRWCLDPQYFFADASLPERARVAGFAAPIRFLQISDDPWGTPAAVGAMASRFTGARTNDIVTVTPQMAGAAKLGHFGYFRQTTSRALWDAGLDWLLAA